MPGHTKPKLDNNELLPTFKNKIIGNIKFHSTYFTDIKEGSHQTRRVGLNKRPAYFLPALAGRVPGQRAASKPLRERTWLFVYVMTSATWRMHAKGVLYLRGKRIYESLAEIGSQGEL